MAFRMQMQHPVTNKSLHSTTENGGKDSSTMKKRPTTEEVFFNDLPECPEQDALEAQFFQRVLLPNGTFKTTASRRLDDLNDFLLPYLRQLADRPLRIMDVGASSGVSTVEWM